MNAALRCRLHKVSLQGHEVLRDISLDVPQGQWTAIVGPNGAGKSTLLRAAAGLIPSNGQVQLGERALHDWSDRERACQLAWLGQNESGADDLTALDVVLLGRLPHRTWLAAPSQADHAAVRSAMQQTQSWQWRERRVSTLSGGERQRVLLARALAVQAPLLLMDEPLAHLDPPHQADWIEIVHTQLRQGRTVMSVLHELNVALQAERLVVMAGGRIVHHGAPGDPLVHAALQEVFDRRLRLLQLDGQWLALPRIR